MFSKRRLWGLAIVIVAAVAGYLLVAGGAPNGPGDIADPEDAYTEADERFHVTTDSTTSRTHSFHVPQGIAAMTVARSLDFPQGGEWTLEDTDGDRVGTVSPQLTGGFLDEPSGATVVHRPETGTWQMTVECEGCAYTLAVYFNDAVSPPEDSLEEDVASADTVVHVDHQQSASSQEGFEVPEDAQSLELLASFYAIDGGSFQIEDPSGDRETRWNWNAEWLSRQTRYVLVEDPTPGTWTIEYSCDVGCEGAWGLSFG